MATDAIKVETVNIEELQAAFRAAPELTTRYVKGEMARATARVRKRFMAARLSGPPGITGGVWKKQHKRHIKFWTAGKDLGALQSGIRLSRFLTIHETGGVITAHKKGRKALRIPIGPRWKLPTRGGFEGNKIRGLFLLRRPGKAPLLAEKIGEQVVPRFVLVNRVVIKARLGFEQSVKQEWPKEFPKLVEAAHRALRVTMESRMVAAATAVTLAAKHLNNRRGRAA